MIFQDWRPYVYGGLSSLVAEFGTFPVDTTKTRLQIQGQVHDAKFKEVRYRGMLHALIRISREEGVRALYSGIKPALLRQATYGTIKIGIYYSLKKRLIKDPHDETLAKNILCAVTAGVFSAAAANPTDVLKVRMQAQQDIYGRKGMVECYKDIFRTEGVKGLWKGALTTAQRAAIVVGVELPVYDIIKKNLIYRGYLGDHALCHFTSSFLAGFAGAVASNPIDVVRTRLMNQKRMKAALLANGRTATVIYTGSVHCAVQTIQTEGFLALYKGFIPTWFRLGPWNIIFFITYEQMKKFY